MANSVALQDNGTILATRSSSVSVGEIMKAQIRRVPSGCGQGARWTDVAATGDQNLRERI